MRAAVACRAAHGHGSRVPPGSLSDIPLPTSPDAGHLDRCRGRERKKAVIIGPAITAQMSDGP
jgi:hypothetical protein